MAWAGRLVFSLRLNYSLLAQIRMPLTRNS
jgi:hypothetical protein